MKCPYLSSASKKKCVKMSAENLDEELTEFDMKHFCDGNPVYCYYFRSPSAQPLERFAKKETPIETLPEEIPLPTVITRNITLEKNEMNFWQE